MAGVHLPGRHAALALAVGAARTLQEEWRASGLRRWTAARPQPEGFGVQPRDFRPPDADAGKAILAGAFVLAGQTLAVGPRGDPWDRPSPSRAFAEALHRFDWLPGLVAAGPDGAAEALRLVLEWRRLFGRWNGFAWSPQVMARRVFNLACAGPALAARASEAETAQLAGDLARQARDLLLPGDPADAASRAASAAVAGAALRGAAGRRLLERALARLARALAATVDADGGHATRRPDLALELLFDLQTLDEAMVQRGLAAPDAVQRAIGRLAAAVRFFTLADGRLAAFHGGRACAAAYVAAARAQDETGDRATPGELSGYQRLDAPRLQVVADVAPPAPGPWAADACAAPLALAVLVGGRRLVDACAGRGIEAAATAEAGETPARVLDGFAGAVLGPRLVDATFAVDVQRHEAPGALWLDLAHHGWMPRYGLMHQRRLYLDVAAGELRGEDRLTPTARAQGPDGRHFIPYAIRFPLHAGVRALVSQDRRSVLLRLEGEADGWILRNDALDIVLEPRPGGGAQLVLRGQRRADSGARVRWKLAPARQPVDPRPPEA
ncbi:MAG: heparinase II/III family protein [Phenylobacterium sp.]|uniref:heparinase II/III family protein n=1 Tax=Phenylobacterium sp. TaxID=1871053 RepID=UPI001A534DFF|nr:heparinase II/III family protein [Phenylobacterium sp.]MBL8772577.1 heparinase II/III family protein [Phenylobacterium sp.]